MPRSAVSAGLLLLVSMAAVFSIEQQVKRKKQELLVHNPWARANPWQLQDKVFCLCTNCTTEPLMKRHAMVARRTAYSHRKIDVTRKLISAGELAKANGSLQLTHVSYGDFIDMFRLYVEGAADETGVRRNLSNVQEQECSLHNESEEPQREDVGFESWHCGCHDTPNAPAMSPNAGGDE